MSAVLAALTAKYAHPEWAAMFEVSNAAGFDRARSADMIAMSCWPSRGLLLHGFEIKVSRSDWLRELKNPAKAEPIMRYCDRWWIVVADDTIVRDGELPPTWGLQVLRGKKLVEVTQAPALSPVALDRGFLAAMLRRASENVVPKSVVAALVAAQVAADVEARIENEKRWEKEAHERTSEQLRTTVKKIQEFAEATGVDPLHYRTAPRPLGEAVRFVLDGGLEGKLKEIDFLADRARAIAADLDRVTAEARATPTLLTKGDAAE